MSKCILHSSDSSFGRESGPLHGDVYSRTIFIRNAWDTCKYIYSNNQDFWKIKFVINSRNNPNRNKIVPFRLFDNKGEYFTSLGDNVHLRVNIWYTSARHEEWASLIGGNGPHSH